MSKVLAPASPSAPAARAAALMAALPMYSSNPARVQEFWHAVARRLLQAGVEGAPAGLTWPASDYLGHWLAPSLLLSQACGYPLVSKLADRVRVVGAFHYGVDGCDGPLCRSALITRANESSCELADFRGRSVAYNDPDSQSGYNAMRSLVAPLAVNGVFFGAQLETGSHRKSVEAVRDGLADIAAVDCVTLAGFGRYTPEVTQGIRVMGYSNAYPGLPLITSATTSDATLAALRAALAAAMQDPGLAALRKDIFLKGFEPLEFSAYRVCTDMRDHAIALGYPVL